jgi:hypothetical protein
MKSKKSTGGREVSAQNAKLALQVDANPSPSSSRPKSAPTKSFDGLQPAQPPDWNRYADSRLRQFVWR